MNCPFCNNLSTSVKDSRVTSEGSIIRRRRECENCRARFSTYETAKLKEISVIKRSGIKKPFDRQKIYNAISTATRKRNVDESGIENIVNNICGILESSKESDIHSRKIGDLILNELAEIDEVAYIRFASVYKDFMTAKDFSKFINMIKSKK
jgi:transcriptional repressor NrdR